MELAQRPGAILRALQITKIEYSLSGGGDSGETTLERVTYRDNPTSHTLPDIPIFISDTGQIQHLPDLLERIVADAPEGDWVNNEGGFGTVYVRPFENEMDLSLECDMTFREDGAWNSQALSLPMRGRSFLFICRFFHGARRGHSPPGAKRRA